MPAPREIYDLQVKADVGPWSDRTRRHPGIVVSQPSPAEAAFVVVPCTGTKPKFTRPCHLHLDERHGTFPIWVQCEYPTTVSGAALEARFKRGSVPPGVLLAIRNKLVRSPPHRQIGMTQCAALTPAHALRRPHGMRRFARS